VTETVTLIAQINEDWRVLRIADRPGWGAPRWSIERKVDSGWRGEATFRVAATVREFVQYNCGPIDPDAARKLSWLPERCDRDPSYPSPPRYPTKRPFAGASKRPRLPRAPAVVATPTKREPASSKRTALAHKFMTWRKPQNEPVVRCQPETAPTPPPAEMARRAPRAATGTVDAEAL
jgi:hypothetical protein